MNNDSFSNLSFYDIMMRDQVKIRLREMMDTGGKDCQFPCGYFDLDKLGKFPNYIQNFMSNFRNSEQKTPRTKIPGDLFFSTTYNMQIRYDPNQSSFIVEYGDPFLYDPSSNLRLVFDDYWLALPTVQKTRFYVPLSEIIGNRIHPEVIEVFSSHKKLIEIVCLTMIALVSSIESYKTLVSNVTDDRGVKRITDGQLDFHQIIAELSMSSDEFKLRTKLNSVYL